MYIIKISYLNCMKRNYWIVWRGTIELYEEEQLNYLLMYCLSLSLCGNRTFWLVHDLNIIQWTILSNKIWNCPYNSDASRACKSAALPIILEGLKYKTNLWKYQTAHGLLLYFRFVCLFLILMCSTVGQILTDCGQCIEVWCVPSATCHYECIKVSIEIWTSDCLLVYILTFHAMLPAGVLSTGQTQQLFPLPWLHLYS